MEGHGMLSRMRPRISPFWRSFRVANGLSCARLDYGELRLACVCLSARLFCTVLRFERESFSRSRSHIATANGRTRASRLFASLGGLTSRHSSFRLPTKSSCCTLAPPKSRFFKLSRSVDRSFCKGARHVKDPTGDVAYR